MARSVTPRPGARKTSSATRRHAGSGRPAAGRRRSAADRRRAAARAQRLRRALIAGVVLAAMVAVLGVVAGVVAVSTAVRGFGECSAFATGRAPVSASAWDDEQLENAGTIISAGRDLGLPARDQAIGVMTAMGESSLRNLEYGDWETSGVTNPDGSRTTSIGLFQQQDSWGPREQRLDPYTAATLFYRAMVRAVPDGEREALDPTIVAHRTQINSDPDHYARYWTAAVAVVEMLSGTDTGLVADAADAPACG